MLIYDNSAVHGSAAHSRTRGSGKQTKGPFTAENFVSQQADYDDLPPLGIFDDEDDDDARIFSQYQQESNTWLLFVCALAPAPMPSSPLTISIL